MNGANLAAAQQVPGLTDTMRLVLESHSNLLRVAMPASVLEYDSSTHKAKVQPLVQYKREGGETQSLAPIAGVPIIHPRTAAGALFLPLAPGDCVTLLVSDRDLSRWKAGSGQQTMPTIARAHDLADCWAIPGGYPDGLAPEPRFAGAMEVWLPNGGKFAVGHGTDEIIDLIIQVIDYIETTITFTNGGGPTGPPTNAPLLAIIKNKLEAFKA